METVEVHLQAVLLPRRQAVAHTTGPMGASLAKQTRHGATVMAPHVVPRFYESNRGDLQKWRDVWGPRGPQNVELLIELELLEPAQ